MSLSDWCDLPSDIWELIFHNLISTDQLYGLSCAAESLAAMGQVNFHTVQGVAFCFDRSFPPVGEVAFHALLFYDFKQ